MNVRFIARSVEYMIGQILRWILIICVMVSYALFATPPDNGPTMWTTINGASAPVNVSVSDN